MSNPHIAQGVDNARPIEMIPQKSPQRVQAREPGDDSDEEQNVLGTPTLIDGYTANDDGNNGRFLAKYGEDLIYVPGLGWHVWDGARFERDVRERVILLAKSVVRGMCNVPDIGDADELKRLVRHAIKSGSGASIREMVNGARADRSVTVDEIDGDKWLLNVKNCTIDLFTGEARPARRSDKITRVSPVVYDPEATCPTFDAFLERVQPNPEIRDFIARWVGYALTGAVKEHCIVIHYGDGRNGKGVLQNTILALLGKDYATQVDQTLLVEKQYDGHPTDKMALLGKRAVFCSETKQEAKLSVATVKTLTGGDRISARYMRQDQVTFEPTHKIALLTNHKPQIDETKSSIWRRIMLVPWDVEIPEAEIDDSLGEKIELELSGVLNWALAGCAEWRRRGLKAPDAVLAATDAYRESEDELSVFFAEKCSISAELSIPRSILYVSYSEWAKSCGQKPVSDKAFAARVRQVIGDKSGKREWGRMHGSEKVSIWKGIGSSDPLVRSNLELLGFRSA